MLYVALVNTVEELIKHLKTLPPSATLSVDGFGNVELWYDDTTNDVIIK